MTVAVLVVVVVVVVLFLLLHGLHWAAGCGTMREGVWLKRSVRHPVSCLPEDQRVAEERRRI